jgi:hypothetical protein
MWRNVSVVGLVMVAPRVMGKYSMQDFEGHLRPAACGCLPNDKGNISVGSWRIRKSVNFC